MKFRGLLLWLHLILGLTGAIVIAIASLTGTWIIVQVPLERLLIRVPSVAHTAAPPDYGAIVSRAESTLAPRRVTKVAVEDGRAIVLTMNDRSRVFADPSSGAILGVRELRLLSFENFSAGMRQLHTSLLMGPRGSLIVTLATMEVVLLALTGLWLWWRKKHWRLFPWRGSIYRVSWDLHNGTGVWFLVPAISMAVTGVLIYFPGPVRAMAGDRTTPYRQAPEVAASSDSNSVPLSRLLAIADSIVPGEPIDSITLPARRALAAGVAGPSGVVYLDRSSGEVMEVQRPLAPTRADRALAAVEQLHTGELLGGAGMFVMALGSTMLAVMTVTGTILGWKRILILSRTRAAVE